MITANTIVQPNCGDLQNKWFNVTTMLWDLAGTTAPNIELIVKRVGEQYGVGVFRLQGCFSAHSEWKTCTIRNVAGYIVYTGQRNGFHPARILPSMLCLTIFVATLDM